MENLTDNGKPFEKKGRKALGSKVLSGLRSPGCRNRFFVYRSVSPGLEGFLCMGYLQYCFFQSEFEALSTGITRHPCLPEDNFDLSYKFKEILRKN